MSDSSDVLINHNLLVLSRESRGLTQREVADALHTSQGWLSRVEHGLRGVPVDVLERMAAYLDYPVAFFQQPKAVVYGLDASELYNRRRQNVPNKLLAKVYAQINIRRMQLERMLESVDLSPLMVLSIDLDEYSGDIDAVAAAVRANWSIPKGPILNVTEVVEDAGVIVIPMDFGTLRIDAISHWVPGTPPLIFMGTHVPPDRWRFTICHELGHIILHRRNVNPDMENQADAFAGAFLMPARDVSPFLVDVSLAKLAELKSLWRVSMAALLCRARDLNKISKSQYTNLCIEMSRMGLRTKEPDLDVPREIPTVYREIVDTLRVDLGYSLAEFCRIVNLSQHEARDLYRPQIRNLRVVK